MKDEIESVIDELKRTISQWSSVAIAYRDTAEELKRENDALKASIREIAKAAEDAAYRAGRYLPTDRDGDEVRESFNKIEDALIAASKQGDDDEVNS